MAPATSALTVHVDEPEEPLVLAIETDAAAGDLLEVDAGLRAELEEASAAAGTAGGLAPVDELLYVGVVLDVAVFVPAAGMSGDFDTVAHHADAVVVGAHLDGLADELGRDRVGVGVKADARLLGHDHRDHDVRVEGMRRQGAQSRALDEQS